MVAQAEHEQSDGQAEVEYLAEVVCLIVQAATVDRDAFSF
jgi:hypothetical protein